MLFRRWQRWGRALLPLWVGVGVTLGCEASPTEGNTGFLVILTNARGPAEIDPGEAWTVRVRELSGVTFPDTTFLMAPVDTVILSVPLATYFVTLDGLPVACSPRNGPIQQGFVPEPGQTATIRFNVDCNAFLVIRTGTVGHAVDSAFVYRVTYPTGHVVFGKAAPSDTIRPDNITAGEYVVDLTHVASNCDVVSGGGERQRAMVEPPRSTLVDFSVICSDERYRPRILRVGSTLRGDRNAFFLEVTDPGSPGAISYPDIDDYYWDLTDCKRNTLLEEGQVGRFGLFRQGSTVRGLDTIRLSVVMEAEILDPSQEPKCIALRVVDNDGNTTPVVEKRLGPPEGSPPVITSFNVRQWGTASEPMLSFTLSASDPDGDLAGSYLRFVLTGGRGAWRGITGHPGTTIPDFRFSSSFLSPEEVVEVQVFVIDKNGNSASASDGDFMN